MRNYTIKKAKSISDYLFLRKLRNKNRFYLTGLNSKIGLLQQLIFWAKKPKNIDLYILYLCNYRAGYLLINKLKKINFITEVVDEKYRKLGLGKKMINFAQGQYLSLRAEIFSENLASIKLHRSMKFKKIKSKNGIEIYNWEMPLYEDK